VNRILVVEDSANERAGLCQLLERSGFRVQAAADGYEALRQIERERFDVLLVDVWLPGMSGLELLSRLPSHARPKSLVITGDDTAETLLAALRKHAYQCITKPFDPVQLIEIIKSALESSDLEDEIEVLSADPHWVELRFSCDRRTVTRIQEFLRQLDSGLPAKVRQSTELAFHELLMNAVEWGGHMDPGSKVQITVLRTDHLLLYRISDPGSGFKPAEMEHAAIGNPPDLPDAHVDVREAKGLRPGGFGILMAQSLVDELVYNEAHNEVVLLKYLNGREH
jgi:DNA-binding response OmpR family regulator